MPRNERLRQHRIERNWRQQEVADQLGIALVTVQRWERGFQQPSAYYRAKLSALFGKSAQELGLLEESSLPAPPEREAPEAVPPAATATLPEEQAQQRLSSPKLEPPWNVPFARNPFFTGRSQLLERLHQQLSHSQRAALTQSAALSGLGGIGKTQTAIEYAYRYREEYSAVLWVRAESRETLMADVFAIAQLLALPGHDAQEQMQVVTAVKRWLQEQQDWLLILDNADDLSLLPDFLPREGQGQLLLTTRAQATGTLARSLAVEKMEVSEGIRFVLRRASLLAEDEPLETVSAANRTAAQRLVEELDGLPLALDQAGAYLEETGCGLSDYLALYGRHQLALLKRESSMASDYPHTVASTWTLSFSQVEQDDPAAADLLRVCAFLHPDAIPGEILTQGAAALGPQLHEVAADALLLNEAIQLLRRYSLVKRDAEANLLNLHRLVQVVLKESLDPPIQRLWAERAMLAVNTAFPQVEHSAWPQCERLLAQALTAAQLIEQYQIVSAEAGRLLHETATYLQRRARYTEAEPLYQRALRIRELQLGPEHPLVATSLDGLAELFRKQGKFAEAEPLYLRDLRIREQQLGPEHPDVAEALNGLAVIYFEQGKFAEAEPLYLRALAIREKTLGPEHPMVAYPLNNLANIYGRQGKYEQAEPLYLRALAIREKTLGPEHPMVASPLNNLGILYYDQGKYAEAEPLYRRALRIREQQLGPEHPDAAQLLNNLANIYCKQGKYAAAEPLYLRTLRIWEQQLGPEHPDVAYPLNNLAELYYEQGKYAEAEPLYLRALAIREKQLGPEHPDVAETLNNLAVLYYEQGKYAAAELLLQRALRIREQQLGPEHPLVAETLNNLANLYRAQGQYEQAEPLYQRALYICEQHLGPEHLDTAETMHDLARYWEARGNSEEARSLYTRALAIREQALGAQHLKTTQTRTHLIDLLHAMDQHENAARLEAD